MEDVSSLAVWYAGLKKHVSAYTNREFKTAFNHLVIEWIQGDITRPPSDAAMLKYRQKVGRKMSPYPIHPAEPESELDIEIADGNVVEFRDSSGKIVISVPFTQSMKTELEKKYRGDDEYFGYYFAAAILEDAIETIGTDNYLLSVPREIQRRAVETGYIYEAFANPLTAGLVLYNKNAYFSSIVKAEEFGSVGNFFEHSIRAPTIMNPPWTETILLEAAKRAVLAMRPVLFIGPSWEDAEFFKVLSDRTKISRKLKVPYYDVHGDKLIYGIESHVWFIGDHLIRETDEFIDEWCEMNGSDIEYKVIAFGGNRRRPDNKKNVKPDYPRTKPVGKIEAPKEPTPSPAAKPPKQKKREKDESSRAALSRVLQRVSKR